MSDTLNINQTREELLQMIMKDAYVKGRVILSSGKESDYYIDARKVALQPAGVIRIAQLMLDQLSDVSFDAIGGPTLGADPMIGALGVVGYQNKQDFSTFIIRKAPKAHGQQQMIEGPALVEGQKVVLVDDVATTGKAFLHSLDVLQKMNIDVVRCLCIVDRHEGAAEAIAERGSQLSALFSINEIHKA